MSFQSWDIPFEDTAADKATFALPRVEDFDLDITCFADDRWRPRFKASLNAARNLLRNA